MSVLGFLGSDQQTRWTGVQAISNVLAIILSLIAIFKPSDSSNLNPRTDINSQTQANPNKTVSPGSNK
ncbi:MAG: hypothetical protein H9536_03755 [Aphanizomenon flos-aquae Clear-A1]|jgi:hypothetical protein|nr:hypothetical protein [Aphanizomenon flos-aquae Clear-A1]